MKDTTILIAEDDPSSSELLTEMLEMDDYTVEVAATAVEVLDALRGRRFSAVLLDLTMPGMSREQFIEGLCDLPSPSPFIVFSARPTQEVREIADSLHATAVLPKPSDVDQMLATIARVARPSA